MALPGTTAIGEAIQAAVKASGYTANTVGKTARIPTVAVHLTGLVKDVRALGHDAVTFNPRLMHEIETYLAASGVPVEQGLKVLKADAAADALVLTANALEGTGREVVIKLTNRLGIFTPMEHLPGNSLHIAEDLMAPAVQTTVKSARSGEPVLVRIEPKMTPVDKIIDALPGDKGQMMAEYTEAMRAKVTAKGLADIDLKPNNFGLAASEPPVTDFADLLTRTSTSIDVDAMRIRTPEMTAQMAKPATYTPTYAEPPKHIDALFKPKELPTLDGASMAPATPEAARAASGERQRPPG